MLAADLSLGVEGGEQRGDPAAITFIGAFLDPSLGDVMEAAAAVEVTTEVGLVSSGGEMFSFTKNASWFESNTSGRSSATKAEQNIMKHARGIVFIQGTLQKPAGSRTYVQIVRLDGESP
jgi:hypothetical protein